MQVAASSLINASSPLKLVDVVFTKNLESLAHTLKKCQIPLLVDDCPALILQFDQQQLLTHQNTAYTGIPLSSSSHECCPNVYSQQQQQQQKPTANIKSQATINTSNNNSNSKACNICNSLSNAQKKGYDTFLNKYDKCSSSNQSLDLELEADADDASENVTCVSCSTTMSLETKADGGCTCANQTPINTTAKAGCSSCPRIVATQNEVMSTLSKMVSCIGCRTSVERFYKQLVCANNSRQVNLLNLDKNMQRKNVSYSYSGSGNGGGGRGGFSAGMGMGGNSSALDPFIIKANGNLTLKKSFLMDPLSIYKLFHLNW